LGEERRLRSRGGLKKDDDLGSCELSGQRRPELATVVAETDIPLSEAARGARGVA